MDNFIRELYKLITKHNASGKVVKALSIVMVFVVTYMLILPAITLDKDEAMNQGGISVPAMNQTIESDSDDSDGEETSDISNTDAEEPESAEPVSDDSVSEEVPDEGISEDKSSSGDSAGAADTGDSFDTDTDKDTNNDISDKDSSNSSDSGKVSDTASDTKSDKKSDNKKEEAVSDQKEDVSDETDMEETDEEEKTEKEGSLKYEGEGFSIEVKDTSSVLPKDAVLQVEEITRSTDRKQYNKLYDDALEAAREDSAENASKSKEDGTTDLGFAKFYDISLVSEGKEIVPDKSVGLTIEYDKQLQKELKVSKSGEVHIMNFAENKKTGKTEPQILDKKDDKVELEVKNDKLAEASFDASFEPKGPTVYAVVGTAIEQNILASDGHNYKVKVTYDNDANIPAGAVLQVTEISKDAASQYQEYLDKTENALGIESGSASYARFFDISIRDENGKKIQPAKGSKVDVKIELDDASSDKLSVVHFADDSNKGDVVKGVETKGQSVSFKADGFSVYAVVDESTDSKARMTLEFYSNGTKIATMYVKNDDGDVSDAELEEILYDPGVGTLGSGEVFGGWIFDKPEYTTADIPSAMTINQIRSWAKSHPITEGETHRFDAAICKLYKITYYDYKGDDNTVRGTTLGLDAVMVKASEFGTATVEYTVNMAYALKDDVHNFEGWLLEDEARPNVTSTIPNDKNYPNKSKITIKGDISFMVNAPKGNWLVFDENGKGGTYNAPQFVKSGQVTTDTDLHEMTRNGYTFGGWYDTKAHADAHGANPNVTTGKFSFGSELTENTTIYASWIPNAQAPYTVILWTQNIDRTAYEVAGSYIGRGRVGQNIPYTVVENGDEDYVTGVGNGNGHYTGFSVVDGDKNQQVTITPEGDAVLNIHYDRILYNFKFYLYRTPGGNNQYSYANNSDTGSTLNNLVNWHNSNNHPNIAPSSGYTIQSETHRFNNTNYTYYYFTLSAYYGEDISSKWPKYDQILGADNREAVSFVMMVGTKLKPSATNQGSGTVKGIITVMNENILGATNDSNGNYVIIRFPNNYNNWRYHIWKETVEGEDYTGKTTRIYNGKTYYEDDVLVVRSSNTQVSSQNEPKYQGFTFVQKRGQNWNDENYWTTGNNPTLYHLNYVYNRDTYKVSYFDGSYVNGNGGLIQNRATHLINESNAIAHGAVIPNDVKNYVPSLPEGEEGYVFEGWYLDEACNTPYEWDKMPVGGIKVYAKWRQVEYRVFLHPNAENDQNLDWGSDNVSTSFRVPYGGKVSTPTGKRPGSGYEFVGWYTDPSMNSDSLYVSDTVLNDETVITPYDQTEETELDKWGNVEPGEEGVNNDAVENRTWITKKLDLYAKWRKILDGSEGIRVIYDPVDDDGNEGTNPPVDESEYPDQADATAQGAATAPSGMYFSCWVVQKWDETQNKFVDTTTTVVPGQKFTVNEANAHKEAVEGEEGTYTYTMKLRAEYIKPDNTLPTHIWWFKNYADTERHEASSRNEGIQINEAVDIVSPLSRDGYIFLGWARIEANTSESAVGEDGHMPTAKVLADLDENDLYLKYENGKFTLNDSTSVNNGKVVTKVAADERLDYHDMYAVWKKKTYTVTVIKITEDTSYQNVPFSFTPSGFPESVEGGSTVFNLVGNSNGATVDGTHYNHSKTFTEVPYGTEFNITEDTGNDYEVSVKYDCTGADDNKKNGTNFESGNGESITVDGNITVRFKNRRKTVPLKVIKIDQEGNALAGATFTSSLYTGEKTTVIDDNNEAVIFDGDVNLDENHQLDETNAPAGYYEVGRIIINVSAEDDSITYTIDGEDADRSLIDRDTTTGKITIKVMNTSGVELPHTGGIGTTLFYIFGSLLVFACGAIIFMRKRSGIN